MRSMQRTFGKLLPRTADESQVAVLLAEFDTADKMLVNLIEATQVWRDSWRDILSTQQLLLHVFQELYEPIRGSGTDFESHHQPILTPRENLQRVALLSGAYEDLRVDMLQEINMIEERIIKPANDARTSIHPMKKVIKKRQDRKLDYENYQGRYDHAYKKKNRTEREEIALAKHDVDLSHSKNEYEIADEKLKLKLPPIISATFSILPHLLASQIMIQNTLLSQWYTILHTYCEEQGFPSPAPPVSEIIAVWSQDFRSTQRELETAFSFISNGKAVRAPMEAQAKPHSSITGLGIRNGISQRRISSQPANTSRMSVSPARSHTSGPPSPSPEDRRLQIEYRPQVNLASRPNVSSKPSPSTLAYTTPNYPKSPSVGSVSPAPSDYLTPSSALTRTQSRDYFQQDRKSSNSSPLSAIAAMKKKPPPPPPKRMPSNQGFWVTAMYDFGGQGQGDLSFREGDRIKVVKKTGSTDDWWEGELRGVQGSFPANYCQPG